MDRFDRNATAMQPGVHWQVAEKASNLKSQLTRLKSESQKSAQILYA